VRVGIIYTHRPAQVLDRYSDKILGVDDPIIGTAGEVLTH
jgi:hypothetical protein